MLCVRCRHNNYGPDFADSSATDREPSKTWLVGTAADLKRPEDTLDYGGYQWNGCPTCTADDPRNREGWVDTALSEQEGNDDLVANYHSRVHLFNVSSPTQLKGYNMTSPVTYSPD